MSWLGWKLREWSLKFSDVRAAETQRQEIYADRIEEAMFTGDQLARIDIYFELVVALDLRWPKFPTDSQYRDLQKFWKRSPLVKNVPFPICILEQPEDEDNSKFTLVYNPEFQLEPNVWILAALWLDRYKWLDQPKPGT